MVSKWMYILIGDDKTGKTTFQKELLKILCEENKDPKLDSAKTYTIKHPYALNKVNSLFLGNRSYQEKKDVINITSVEKYFERYFKPSDICILSSHLNITDIQEMIKFGKMHFYNIGGVFWANSIKNEFINKDIALLNWDERFTINNELISEVNKPKEEFDAEVNNQIKILAYEFAQMLINRMSTQ